MKQEKFKVLLYLKKSGLDKSGKAPIMVRITVNNSMAQFSSKLSCTPALWNSRESRLTGKSREAVEINQRIENLLLSVHSAFDSLRERKKPFDAESVKHMYQGNMDTQMTLLAYLDRHVEELRAHIAPGTLRVYACAQRSLGKFIKRKFNTDDVAFGQLNEYFIQEYKDFVSGEMGCAPSTLCRYLIILKRICRIAFKEGVSEKCYFAHYKLSKPKESTPKALSQESFEKIRDLKMSSSHPSVCLTRDLFLFACYTGIACVDVLRITGENVSTDEKGSLWLNYRRKKTDQQAQVKLLPEAIALIEKYRSGNRGTLFPLQSAKVIRSNMRALRVMADIKEPMTFHVARHSFASLITLEEGVSIESISRMLGHSNIRTTQIYARVTPKKLFEDMDKLIKATADLKLVI